MYVANLWIWGGVYSLFYDNIGEWQTWKCKDSVTKPCKFRVECMLQIDGYEAEFRVYLKIKWCSSKHWKCKDSVTKPCKLRVECMLQIDGYEAEFRVYLKAKWCWWKHGKCKDSVTKGDGGEVILLSDKL